MCRKVWCMGEDRFCVNLYCVKVLTRVMCERPFLTMKTYSKYPRLILACAQCTSMHETHTCICTAWVELSMMVAPLLPADSAPLGPSAVVQLYGTDNLVPLALPMITQWHHVFDSFACGHCLTAAAGVGPHQPWSITSTACVFSA